MANPFNGGRVGLAGPKAGIVAITPDDDTDLDDVGVGMFTVDGGAIKFTDDLGATHTITFPAWSSIDVGVRRVFATDTNATVIYVGAVK